MIYLDQIEERDIDFLVMRAFVDQPRFAALFLAKAGWKGAQVTCVEHSLTDPALGESDITIIVALDGKRHGLLIEDKIDAPAMPMQCRRYYERGNVGVANGDYDDFAVFLIAPQSYLDDNAEARNYENRISYEEMRTTLQALGAGFDCAVLERAVAKKASGYVLREVPAITQFWQALYDYCRTSGKAVEMYAPSGAKGVGSTWPQFRTPLRGTALYYKAGPGVVDLQFSGMRRESVRLKAALRGRLTGAIHWADTGNSISLRIKVAPMEFRNPFTRYPQEIAIMLNAVETLTAFAVKLNDNGFSVSLEPEVF